MVCSIAFGKFFSVQIGIACAFRVSGFEGDVTPLLKR
jgi:hypothetical protein